MKKRFRLTFEVVTEESARDRDVDRRGFVSDAGRPYISPVESDWMPEVPDTFCLRDAADFLLSRESSGPVEADSYPILRSHPPALVHLWRNNGCGRRGDIGFVASSA